MQNKFAAIAMIMVIMIGMTGLGAATYTSTMLDNKVGYGATGAWDLTPGDFIGATLVYGDSGDDFVWHVSGTVPESMAGEDYSLIYYADYPDPFNHWGGDNPGAFIGDVMTDSTTGDFDATGSIDLGMSLPCAPDANIDGAKLWMIPSADYNNNTFKMTAWNPANYLFETEMITYNNVSTQAGGDDAVISIGNSFVCEGNVDSIIMPIVISNSINVGGVDLTLTYDESLVTITDIVNGDMEEMLAPLTPIGDNQIHISTNQNLNPGIGAEFNLAYITFVPSATATGICDIEIIVTSFVDCTFDTLEMECVTNNGTFYIDEYTVGDVNYNGDVNIGDVMVLAKYVSGMSEFQDINTCAADIDCDSSKIDVNDVAYLAKHLHKMTDYETIPCVS